MKKIIISMFLVCTLVVTTYASSYDEIMKKANEALDKLDDAKNIWDKTMEKLQINKEKYEKILNDPNSLDAEKSFACNKLNHDGDIIEEVLVCDINNNTNGYDKPFVIVREEHILPFSPKVYIVYAITEIDPNTKKILKTKKLKISNNEVCFLENDWVDPKFIVSKCSDCNGAIRKALIIPENNTFKSTKTLF